MADPHRRLTAATVAAERGMVVSTLDVASEVGAEVLRSGGNAVDAAIAANAVVGVMLPDTCGPGGDLFALVHRDGWTEPATLNASGRAGSGADPEALRAHGHATVPIHGPHGVTVPGCVDGWEALCGSLGSMSLAEVLAPAITIAANGFEVSTELADSLARTRDLLTGPGSAAPSAVTLYPDGKPPPAGSRLRRPDLATTLEAVAAEGRSGFYAGAVGDAITAATGGVITAADLAVVQADWVEPAGLQLHGLQAWTVPPNSRGYVTLAATWLAERLDSEPGTPERAHHLIEAYRAVAEGSTDVVADPSSTNEDLDEVLSPRRLEELYASIGDERSDRRAPPRAAGGTTYLCCRDGSGLGVSLIQSNFHGIGSGLSAGDTGVFLHDRGAGFNLVPGHANELGPGKRPAHTLSPMLWTDHGSLRMLLGTRGGSYQPQLLIQVIDHLMGDGLSLPAAMARPRWVIEDDHADAAVRIESRAPAATIDGLRARHHRVTVAGPLEVGWGPVSAITVDGALVSGAADPRVSTAAVAIA